MENERIRPTGRFYELLETIIAGEGNLKEADKAAGLKFGTFSRWTTQKEREVSAELLIVLARNLGKKYGFTREQVYVMAGLLEPPDEASVGGNSQANVPLVGHRTPADLTIPLTIRLVEALPPGLLAEAARYLPEVEQAIAANQWVGVTTEHFPSPASAPPNAFILKVTGHCMETCIPHGSRVLVDRARQAEPGNVVLVVRGNEATLKRLVIRADGSFVLVPDNSLFAPIELDQGDARIVGVVIDVFHGMP